MLNNSIDQVVITTKIEAFGLLAKQKFIEAEKLLMDLLSYNPLDDEAIYLLSMVKHAKGETEVSKFLLNKAIEKNPHDARYWTELGAIAIEQNYLQEALNLFAQALKIKSDYPHALRGIATAYYLLRDFELSKEYYEQLVKIVPNDQTSIHMLKSLKGETTEAAPEAYVKNLFNKYADKFENHLKEKLDYKTPEEIARLVSTLKFNDNKLELKALDLGCGTGLAAEEILKFNDKFAFTGLDLSEKMVEISKAKNIYKKLHVGEILEYLKSNKKNFDLIVAADVFVYIGELSEIMQEVNRSLISPGYMVFSVEKNDDVDTFSLIPTSARYAHSKKYIEKLAKDNGFNIEIMEEIDLRKEGLDIIKGYLVIFCKA
ncbi:MAG: methyltransferase domain-containing protein [Sphingobacteriia bacterium]|nr:methyltransferase domain-containing protein [Sphingobacteriia bacterium]